MVYRILNAMISPRMNVKQIFSTILVVNLFICFAKAKGILRWLRWSHSLLNHTTKWSENEAIIRVAGDITGEVISSRQKQSHKNALICQCVCVRAYTTGQEFPALPFFLWNFSIACNGSLCFLLGPGLLSAPFRYSFLCGLECFVTLVNGCA